MANLSVRTIVKRFQDAPVLKGVSLDIRDGEFMTLVGPSGCGKSTLLRILAGLETQDGGDVELDGVVVNALRPKHRDVAMVFQSYALYPHLTVFENMAVPLTMRRLNGWQRLPLVGRVMPGRRAAWAAIEAEVRAVAQGLHIGHLLDRKPGQLSGGQRQRVALGRAMVRRPKVFLMDEPLSNLDAKLRVHMRAEIAQLHRSLRGTFVYVTHDQAEAMTMSDRIAVMMDGEILQVATPEEVYGRPTDIRVAEFIGSPKINLLPASRAAAGLDVLGHVLPLRPQGEAGGLTVGVRPEALRVAAPTDGLRGHVVHRENLGAEVFLHVVLDRCPDAPPVVARLAAAEAEGAAVGMVVGLVPDASATLIFGADGRRLEAQEGLSAHAARGQVAHG